MADTAVTAYISSCNIWSTHAQSPRLNRCRKQAVPEQSSQNGNVGWKATLQNLNMPYLLSTHFFLSFASGAGEFGQVWLANATGIVDGEQSTQTAVKTSKGWRASDWYLHEPSPFHHVFYLFGKTADSHKYSAGPVRDMLDTKKILWPVWMLIGFQMRTR